jgi:hypothetical protein
MALANYSKVCSKNVGGNSTLWLIEASSYSAHTIVSDEITVFTLDTSTTFKTYEIDQDTLVRSEEAVGTGHNISYTHAVEFSLRKPSAAMRTAINAIADASPCGMIAVIKDGNGLYWVVGFNAQDLGDRGLKLVSETTTSGASPDDEEGSKTVIRLECKSGYKALPVASGSTVAVGGITA